MDCVELCGIRTRVPAMVQLLDTLRRIAPLHAPVLIQGETGAGKELVARALHVLGDRSGKPFVAADCGALGWSFSNDRPEAAGALSPPTRFVMFGIDPMCKSD